MKSYIFILPFIFIQLSAQTKKDSLIVFVGQKISVIQDEEKIKDDTLIENGDTIIARNISFDHRYLCRYKILKKLNGIVTLDTITFYAFDHYGTPKFSRRDTVLLFVSAFPDGFFHQKYLYFDLYLTESGRWTSPYSTDDYNHPLSKTYTVRPEIINFKNEVSFSIDKIPKKYITQRYPKPYYTIKNNKAVAVYGNYLEDLFLLRQQGILKARGIY